MGVSLFPRHTFKGCVAMQRLTVGALGCLTLILVAGCSSGPRLMDADEVIKFKRDGADDSALLALVQDPALAFNLSQPDFDRLSKAGINEAVIGELRWRTEEYRRSNQPRAEPHKHDDKQPASGGHQH